MANYVAGHVDDPDLMDSLIGIEFEPDHNWIAAYVNEEEVSLTYSQTWELRGLLQRALSEYEWHNAEWVEASEGFSMSTKHLMRKGEHDKLGKTLCGQLPHRYKYIDAVVEWKLVPLLGEPSRTKRNKVTGGMCQRCLAVYDKRVKEVSA